MPHWYEDNSRSIGRTPLVRLNRVTDGAHATVLAKIEGAARPIRSSAASAPRWSGTPRSGACSAPARSWSSRPAATPASRSRSSRRPAAIPLTLTMPETMSLERRKLLVAYGAKLVLTEGARGMSGAIAKAEEIAASDPDRYVLLQQFTNPANPAIHETTTGPEIWDDTDGAIDILVSGVGTGGTITGVSRYIKQPKEADRLGRRRAHRQSRADAAARRPAAEARAAQDPGDRRGLRPGGSRPLARRRCRAGQQRRLRPLRAAPRSRGGHPGRHFVRGRRRSRGRASRGVRKTTARPSSSCCPIPASGT